ncbi:MAG: hypothetical protein LBT59_18210 [Clostridiales bacterium]|jgi:hypothetical protein|nr:hypothetical protein [Clostridiales bacterium]
MSQRARRILLAALFALLGNAFVLSMKLGERYIYYWDIAGYWIRCMEYSKALFGNPAGAMGQLFRSLASDDYTLLPVLPYALVFRFFNSQLAFALSSFNIYCLPFLLLLWLFIRKELKIESIWADACVLLALLTCTVLLTPSLGGYLDAAGLPFAVLIVMIARGLKLDGVDLPRILGLALCTLILAFMRRWYTFWIVSFYVAYFGVYGIQLIFVRHEAKKALFLFLNLCSSGLIWLAILYVFFRPFLHKLIFNDYSYAYSAYDRGGISYSIKFFFGQAGLAVCVIAALGAALSLRDRERRPFALFLMLQSVLAFFLFTRIQSLGIQHLLLFVPALLYFCACAISQAKTWGLLSVIILLSLNFATSYYAPAAKVLAFADPVFSQKKLFKRNRTDMETVQGLADFVNETSQGRKYSYVLSSSDILNTDILSNCRLPETRYAVSKILYALDVDKRDGVPYPFFLADILIVADPVQQHLDPSEQRIVGVLADAIISGKADDSLRLIRAFELNGAVARVYERTGPYSDDFINLAKDSLADLYSGIPWPGAPLDRIFNVDLPPSMDILPHVGYFYLSQNGKTGSFSFNAEGWDGPVRVTLSPRYGSTKTSLLVLGEDDAGALKAPISEAPLFEAPLFELEKETTLLIPPSKTLRLIWNIEESPECGDIIVAIEQG